MLNWAKQFNIFCLLDNNEYHFEEPGFECLLAAGCKQSVLLEHPVSFETLQSFHVAYPGWLFGHFNYPSPTKDDTGFPAGFFFIPQIIIRLTKEDIYIECEEGDPRKIFEKINAQDDFIKKRIKNTVAVQSRFPRQSYLDIIHSLKEHIHRGDCYEINFCQDFFSTDAQLDPFFLYYRLNEVSPNPFAGLYRVNDKYCICASPERFIKKSGQTIISQPIKGTSKRNLSNTRADAESKEYLLNNTKEKSENVMVVDLVRNDMSRVCTEGSVFVKELFGVYAFPQVYQMISTIQGTVSKTLPWTKIIEACFPMGSMTGAPKTKVMELINRYETYSRGLFSGAIGYITPQEDFDFNVVIRSLFFNESKKYLSFKAGSGITFYSDPVLEYEECMVKASAIISILEEN